MKYIIDVPDNQECFYDTVYKTLDLKFCGKYFGTKVSFHAEPYTEPDRKVIKDEVWELARKIADMGCEEFSKCFDVSDDYWEANIMDIMTYQDAKAKYEAWKKQKDEIVELPKKMKEE